MSFSKSEGSRYTNTKSNHFPCWANYLWLGLLLDRFQCSEIRCVLKSCQTIGNKPALSLTQQFSYYQKHAPEGVSSLAWASGHLLQFATLIDLDGPFNNFIVPLQNGDVPVHYVRNYQRISFILLPQHFFFGKPAAFRWTTSKSSAACRILSLEPSWRETDWGTQGGHRVQTNGSFNHQKWINMELRGELI